MLRIASRQIFLKIMRSVCCRASLFLTVEARGGSSHAARLLSSQSLQRERAARVGPPKLLKSNSGPPIAVRTVRSPGATQICGKEMAQNTFPGAAPFKLVNSNQKPVSRSETTLP